MEAVTVTIIYLSGVVQRVNLFSLNKGPWMKEENLQNSAGAANDH
jgi:hypothetical protein